MADKTITYRREKLYEEVWKEALRTVAQRYGVSDVALRKVCRRLRVPLPERGHWARTRERRGRRPSLLPLADGVPDRIIAERWTPRAMPSMVEPVGPPIVVPDELQRPHKLVVEASRLLRGRESRDGLVSCRSTRCLDIAVAPASLPRALRIMNALIRAMEERGLQVEITRPLSYEEGRSRGVADAPSNATHVMVSGEWIQFGLTEKRSPSRPAAPDPPRHLRGAELESWIIRNEPRQELVPNGVLELSIKNGSSGVRALWRDGKRQRVEDCLSDFDAHLQVTADAIKRDRDERLRVKREYEERERRRCEEEQRRREEAERARQLEQVIGQWLLAGDVRRYVAEVRAVAADADATIVEGSELDRSLKWAEGYASRIDPLTRVREEIAPRSL